MSATSTPPSPPDIRPSSPRPSAGGRLRAALAHPADPALRVFRALVAVDLAVIVLHVANKLLALYLPMFDLDKEQNLPTWVSSLQLAGVALGAWLLSREVSGRLRTAALVLVAVFLFLSLDELALIHEEMVQQVTSSATADLWFWPVLYSPLAAACVFAAIVLTREARATLGSSWPLLGGFGLLVGAILLDGVATAIVDIRPVFAVELILEETLELVGGALLLSVMLALYLARARSAGPGRGT